jgi:predicted aspartyl protease
VATDRPVISDRFPYVKIQVRVGSFDIEREALLDTGFEGFLVLAEGSLPRYEAPDSFVQWNLADGPRVTTPAYVGAINIGSREIAPAIVIELGDESIIGLRVIERFRVVLDHGRQVVFEI